MVREPGLAELAALLLGGAAPDARLLIGVERELEALAVHRTDLADLLGRLDLVEGDAGGAHREEQLGVRVPAQ